MSSTIIPAQAGFKARWHTKAGVREEPIVAWLIDPDAINPIPKPIGVYGLCDDKSIVVDSSGKAVQV